MSIGTPLVSTATSGTASPAAITAPAGRGVGDLLIVGYTQDSTTRSVTTPAGWTLIDGPITSSSQRGYAYGRIADGTATDNFSAVISGATNWICGMLAYPGVNTSGAILTTAIIAHGANSDASAVLAMTTPALSASALGGCVLVGIFTVDATSTLRSFLPTSTSPSVGTPIERYDKNEGTGFLVNAAYDTVGLTLAPSTSYQMTATCNGSEVGTHYAFMLAQSVPTTPHGTATGSISVTGNATGHVAHHGTTTGAIATTGSATGHSTHRGTATGSASISGSATGHSVHRTTVAGSVSITGSATGTTPAIGTKHGTAVGSIATTGSATGHTVDRGQATGSIGVTGSATGTMPAVGAKHGTATGAIATTGSAVGHATYRGQATGAIGVTGSATGTAPGVGVNNGTATGTVAITGSATGHAPTVGAESGAASGNVSITGTAVGHSVHGGVSSGAVSIGGTATGYAILGGSAQGSIAIIGYARGWTTIIVVIPIEQIAMVHADDNVSYVRSETRVIGAFD